MPPQVPQIVLPSMNNPAHKDDSNKFALQLFQNNCVLNILCSIVCVRLWLEYSWSYSIVVGLNLALV